MVERLTGWPALRWVGLAIAFLALGAWLRGCWMPEPAVVYRDVVVPREVLVRGEPDTVVRWRERIVYRTVTAEQRASAPGAAASDVQAFCAAAGWIAPGAPASPVPDADTLPGSAAVAAVGAPSSPSLPRPAAPLAFARSGRFDGRTLDLWAVTSAGDLRRETFRVRAPFQFAMGGDSAIVQGSRLWWLRPLAAVGVCAAGGYVGTRTESAVPVAVGCGLGATIAVR